jgi:uncharacterized membrane protein YvbJ
VNALCPNCKKEMDDGNNFCPHCGHKSDTTKMALTSTQRRRIYLASFFLTPLGLYWFFKYFRDDKPENRKVAYISLIFTFVPLILIVVTIGKYVNSLSGVIDAYETNLEVYSELGI